MISFDSSIRIKTDKKYKSIYNELKDRAVGDMHELFYVCACIGYKTNKRKPLGSNGDDRFWSRTIIPEEYACYCAMILENSNMDLNSIKDDKIVLKDIEEYANGGMEVLIDELLSPFVIIIDCCID